MNLAHSTKSIKDSDPYIRYYLIKAHFLAEILEATYLLIKKKKHFEIYKN